MRMLHTIISNVGDLKASGAVGLIGLEVNPETSGASCEGDGPLVRLACLVGGDGCSRPLQRHIKDNGDQSGLYDAITYNRL